MRKLRVGFLALAVAGLFLGALGGAVASGGDGAEAAKKRKATVKLGDDFFSPAKKTVKKRTVVRFKWIGKNKHNVVKTKGPGPTFASTTTDSPGVNFKKKFTKKGGYTLVCTIHDGMKMKLRVK